MMKSSTCSSPTADVFGYDVVLRSATQERQVQLKTKRFDSRTSTFNLQKALEGLPSACVVILEWKIIDDRLAFVYRWFGGMPGRPIPDLGDRVARHAKGDAQGIKNERKALRKVNIGAFERVGTISELSEKLFGPARA